MTEQQIILGTQYRKSSYSGANNNNCVEVAIEVATTVSVCVRDTKDAARTTLRFTAEEWKAFIAGVKAGEFELA
ncbi:hypothetical protein ABH926_009343 [Catenulispora sp. GP43]|uniref:DUF397 domain-containing protein n=1 Tax=Catenulispora sp. GP43 TaxID=3156263 RepID=UPI0035159ADC